MLVKTATTLEQVREILGISAWSFWNWTIPDCQVREGCTGTWLQSVGDEVTRQELALAVQQAERLLENYLGFNILPKYQTQTLYPMRYKLPGYTVSGATKTIQTKKRGYLIEIGAKKKELLLQFTVVPTDQDGDGFKETAVIDISQFNSTDINELRVFYAGRDIEIRPIKITDVGQIRTITFPMYLIPKWEKIYLLCEDAIDSGISANYETKIDLYRIYTDKTDQVNLIYNPPSNCVVDCGKTKIATCGYVSEHELGYLAYNPTNLAEPNAVEVKFLSGWQGTDVDRVITDIDPLWVTPVAALAVSLLEANKTCCGGNTPKIMSHWQTDLTLSDEDLSRFVILPLLVQNFGVTTMGGFFAQQFAESYRLFLRP